MDGIACLPPFPPTAVTMRFSPPATATAAVFVCCCIHPQYYFFVQSFSLIPKRPKATPLHTSTINTSLAPRLKPSASCNTLAATSIPTDAIPPSLISSSNHWGNVAALAFTASFAQLLGKTTLIGNLLGAPVTAMALTFVLSSVGCMPSFVSSSASWSTLLPSGGSPSSTCKRHGMKCSWSVFVLYTLLTMRRCLLPCSLTNYFSDSGNSVASSWNKPTGESITTVWQSTWELRRCITRFFVRSQCCICIQHLQCPTYITTQQ